MNDPSASGGRVTIDLDALAANWRSMAERSGTATAAAVKGDAYGLGIEPAVRSLADAGCGTFFVALPDEGCRVRAVAPEATIYVLGGLIGDAAPYVAAGLRPVLNSPGDIAAWRAARRDGAPTGAALHVDTGMNRLGLRLDMLRDAVAADPDFTDALGLTLLMSHLACADTPEHPLNARQLAVFRAARDALPGVSASLANSAGVFLGREFCFDLVRPGIALYGGNPVSRAPNPMRPVVRLEARVLQVRDVPAGETVGYGASETMERPSRIAVVAVGYADGYLRRSGSDDTRSGATAFLHGRAAPLVGRVSMDLLAVDVTDIPEAARGDWVELFGRNIAIDDVAGHADTISYELLTGLGSRYARRYEALD